jgi:hypothetical protein
MNHLLRPRNWEPACGTEPSAASANYMAVLPGVLGCSFGSAQDRLPLRRTVQVRLGTNTLRLPGGPPASPERSRWRAGTPICVVSRQQFMKYPGYLIIDRTDLPLPPEAEPHAGRARIDMD